MISFPVNIPLDRRPMRIWLLDRIRGLMIIHPTAKSPTQETLVNAVAWYFKEKGGGCGIHPVSSGSNTTDSVVVAKMARAV